MKTPTVLMVATNRWFASARIAMTLSQSGCRVTACCLPDHPFEKTGILAQRFPIHALHPVQSVLSALHWEFPDLIVACDERATGILHQLYERSGPNDNAGNVRELIQRSLGDPRYFAAASSRASVLDRATALGVRIPTGGQINSMEALKSWLKQNGYPAFLKADGTSGGTGVKRISTLQEAVGAYRKLHAPPMLLKVLKRLVVNRDPILLLPYLRRERPVISVQRAIEGHEATAAVSCWQGEVLSTLCMQVLQRTEPQGPASVLRHIENPEMVSAAAALVKSLGLSGLIGLDFMLEESTGHAYLLELNLRATQTSHLCMGPEHAPAYALGAKLQGLTTARLPLETRREVALFPQEWVRDPRSRFLQGGFHDIPLQAPELVREALKLQTGGKNGAAVEQYLREMQEPSRHAA